jgi:preprotein translocase SecE subunit
VQRRSLYEFLKAVLQELAKFSWPSSTVALRNAAVVLGFLATVILLLLAMDLLTRVALDGLTS